MSRIRDELPLFSPDRLRDTRVRLAKLLSRERELSNENSRPNNSRMSRNIDSSDLRRNPHSIQEMLRVRADFIDKRRSQNNKELPATHLPYVLDAGSLEELDLSIDSLQEELAALSSRNKVKEELIAESGSAHLDALNTVINAAHRRPFAPLGVGPVQLWHTSIAESLCADDSKQAGGAIASKNTRVPRGEGSSTDSLHSGNSNLWCARTDGIRVSMGSEVLSFLFDRDGSGSGTRSNVPQGVAITGRVITITPDDSIWGALERGMRAVDITNHARDAGASGGSWASSDTEGHFRQVWHRIIVALIPSVHSSGTSGTVPMACILGAEVATAGAIAGDPNGHNMVPSGGAVANNGDETSSSTEKENMSGNYVFNSTHVPQYNSSRRILRSNTMKIKSIIAQQFFTRLAASVFENIDVRSRNIDKKFRAIEADLQRKKDLHMESRMLLLRQLTSVYTEVSFDDLEVHDKKMNVDFHVENTYLLSRISRIVVNHLRHDSGLDIIDGACAFDNISTYLCRTTAGVGGGAQETISRALQRACIDKASDADRCSLISCIQQADAFKPTVITTSISDIEEARIFQNPLKQDIPDSSDNDKNNLVELNGNYYAVSQNVTVIGIHFHLTTNQSRKGEQGMIIVASERSDKADVDILLSHLKYVANVVHEAASRCLSAFTLQMCEQLRRFAPFTWGFLCNTAVDSEVALSTYTDTSGVVAVPYMSQLALKLRSGQSCSMLGCQGVNFLFSEAFLKAMYRHSLYNQDTDVPDTRVEMDNTKMFRFMQANARSQSMELVDQQATADDQWLSELQNQRIIMHHLGPSSDTSTSYSVHAKTGVIMSSFNSSSQQSLSRLLRCSYGMTDLIDSSDEEINALNVIMIPAFATRQHNRYTGSELVGVLVMMHNVPRNVNHSPSALIERYLTAKCEALIKVNLMGDLQNTMQTCCNLQTSSFRKFRLFRLQQQYESMFTKLHKKHETNSIRSSFQYWQKAIQSQKLQEELRGVQLINDFASELVSLKPDPVPTQLSTSGFRSQFQSAMQRQARKLFPGDAITVTYCDSGADKLEIDDTIFATVSDEGGTTSTSNRVQERSSLIGYIKKFFRANSTDRGDPKSTVVATVTILRGKSMPKFSPLLVSTLRRYCETASAIYSRLIFTDSSEIALQQLVMIMPSLFATLISAESSLGNARNSAEATQERSPGMILKFLNLLPQVAHALKVACGADVAMIRVLRNISSEVSSGSRNADSEVLVSSADWAHTVPASDLQNVQDFVDFEEGRGDEYEEKSNTIQMQLLKGSSSGKANVGSINLIGVDKNTNAINTARTFSYFVAQICFLHGHYSGIIDRNIKQVQLIGSMQDLLKDKVKSSTQLQSIVQEIKGHVTASARLVEWVKAFHERFQYEYRARGNTAQDRVDSGVSYLAHLLNDTLPSALSTDGDITGVSLLLQKRYQNLLKGDFLASNMERYDSPAAVEHVETVRFMSNKSSDGLKRDSIEGDFEQYQFQASYSHISTDFENYSLKQDDDKVLSPASISEIPFYADKSRAQLTKINIFNSERKSDASEIEKAPIAILLVRHGLPSSDSDAMSSDADSHSNSNLPENLVNNCAHAVLHTAISSIKAANQTGEMQSRLLELRDASTKRDQYYKQWVESQNSNQEAALQYQRRIAAYEETTATLEEAIGKREKEVSHISEEMQIQKEKADNSLDRLRDHVLALENDLYSAREAELDSLSQKKSIAALISSFTTDQHWRSGDTSHGSAAVQWLYELADSKDLLCLKVGQTTKGTLTGGGGIRGIIASSGEALRTSQPTQFYSNISPLVFDHSSSKATIDSSSGSRTGASILCIPNRCISSYQQTNEAVFILYRPSPSKEAGYFGEKEVDYWNAAVNLVSRQLLKVSSAPDIEEYATLSARVQQIQSFQNAYKLMIALHGDILRRSGVRSSEFCRIIESAIAQVLNTRISPFIHDCEADCFMLILPSSGLDSMDRSSSSHENVSQLHAGEYKSTYAILNSYGFGKEAATVQKVLASLSPSRYASAVWLPVREPSLPSSLSSSGSQMQGNENSGATKDDSGLIALLRVERKIVHSDSRGEHSSSNPDSLPSSTDATRIRTREPTVQDLLINPEEVELILQFLKLLTPLVAQKEIIDVANANIHKASDAILHLESEISQLHEKNAISECNIKQCETTLQCGLDIIAALRSSRSQWGAQIDAARKSLLSITNSDECFIILPGSVQSFMHLGVEENSEARSNAALVGALSGIDSTGTSNQFFALSPDSPTLYSVRFEEGDLEMTAIRRRRIILARGGSSTTADDPPAWRSWAGRRLLQLPHLRQRSKLAVDNADHAGANDSFTSSSAEAAYLSACIVPFVVRAGVIPQEAPQQALVVLLRRPSRSSSSSSSSGGAVFHVASPYSDVDTSCVSYVANLLSYCLEVHSGSVEGLQEARARILEMSREIQQLRDASKYALKLEIDNEALQHNLLTTAEPTEFPLNAPTSLDFAETFTSDVEHFASDSRSQTFLTSDDGGAQCVSELVHSIYADAQLITEPSVLQRALNDLSQDKEASRLDNKEQNKPNGNSAVPKASGVNGILKGPSGRVQYWLSPPSRNEAEIGDPLRIKRSLVATPQSYLYFSIYHQFYPALHFQVPLKYPEVAKANENADDFEDSSPNIGRQPIQLVNLRLRFALLLRLLDGSAIWRERCRRLVSGSTRVLESTKETEFSRLFTESIIHAALTACQNFSTFMSTTGLDGFGKASKNSPSALQEMRYSGSSNRIRESIEMVRIKELWKLFIKTWKDFGITAGISVSLGRWVGGNDSLEVLGSGHTTYVAKRKATGAAAALAEAIPTAPTSTGSTSKASEIKITSIQHQRQFVLQHLTEWNNGSIKSSNDTVITADEKDVASAIKYASVTNRTVVATFTDAENDPASVGGKGNTVFTAIEVASRLLSNLDKPRKSVAIEVDPSTEIPSGTVLIPLSIESFGRMQAVVMLQAPHPKNIARALNHPSQGNKSYTSNLASVLSSGITIADCVLQRVRECDRMQKAQLTALKAAILICENRKKMRINVLKHAFKHMKMHTLKVNYTRAQKLAQDTLSQGARLRKLEGTLSSWLRLHRSVADAVSNSHTNEQQMRMPSSIANLWQYLSTPLCSLLSAELSEQSHDTQRLQLKSIALCIPDSEAVQQGDVRGGIDAHKAAAPDASVNTVIDLEVHEWQSSHSPEAKPIPSGAKAVIATQSIAALGRQITDRVSQLLNVHESSPASGLYRLQYTELQRGTGEDEYSAPDTYEMNASETGEDLFMWLFPVSYAGRTVAVLRLVLLASSVNKKSPASAGGSNNSIVRNSDGVWLDVLQPLTPHEETIHSHINRFLDMCAPHFYDAQAVHSTHSLLHRTNASLQHSVQSHLSTTKLLQEKSILEHVTDSLQANVADYLCSLQEHGPTLTAARSDPPAGYDDASSALPTMQSLLPSLLARFSTIIKAAVSVRLGGSPVEGEASVTEASEIQIDPIPDEWSTRTIAPVTLQRRMSDSRYGTIGIVTVKLDASMQSARHDKRNAQSMDSTPYGLLLKAALSEAENAEAMNDSDLLETSRAGDVLMTRIALLLSGAVSITETTAAYITQNASMSSMKNSLNGAIDEANEAQSIAESHKHAALFYMHIIRMVQQCVEFAATTPLLGELSDTDKRLSGDSSEMPAEKQAISNSSSSPHSLALPSSTPSHLSSILATILSQLPAMTRCTCIFAVAEIVPDSRLGNLGAGGVGQRTDSPLKWYYHDSARKWSVSGSNKASYYDAGRNYRGAAFTLMSPSALDAHTLVTTHNIANDYVSNYNAEAAQEYQADSMSTSDAVYAVDIVVPKPTMQFRDTKSRVRNSFGSKHGIRVMCYPLCGPVLDAEPDAESGPPPLLGVLQVLVDLEAPSSQQDDQNVQPHSSLHRSLTPLEPPSHAATSADMKDVQELSGVTAGVVGNLLHDYHSRQALGQSVVNLERDVRTLANKAVEYQGQYILHKSRAKLWKVLQRLQICLTCGDLRTLMSEEEVDDDSTHKELQASKEMLDYAANADFMTIEQVLDAAPVRSLLASVGITIALSNSDDSLDTVGVSDASTSSAEGDNRATQNAEILATNQEKVFEVVLRLTRRDGSDRELRVRATDDPFEVAKSYIQQENLNSSSKYIAEKLVPKLAALIEEKRENAYAAHLLRATSGLAGTASTRVSSGLDGRSKSNAAHEQDEVQVSAEEGVSTPVKYSSKVYLEGIGKWASLALVAPNTVDVDPETAMSALRICGEQLEKAVLSTYARSEFQGRVDSFQSQLAGLRADLQVQKANQTGLWMLLERIREQSPALLNSAQNAGTAVVQLFKQENMVSEMKAKKAFITSEVTIDAWKLDFLLSLSASALLAARDMIASAMEKPRRLTHRDYTSSSILLSSTPSHNQADSKTHDSELQLGSSIGVYHVSVLLVSPIDAGKGKGKNSTVSDLDGKYTVTQLDSHALHSRSSSEAAALSVGHSTTYTFQRATAGAGTAALISCLDNDRGARVCCFLDAPNSSDASGISGIHPIDTHGLTTPVKENEDAEDEVEAGAEAFQHRNGDEHFISTLLKQAPARTHIAVQAIKLASFSSNNHDGEGDVGIAAESHQTDQGPLHHVVLRVVYAYTPTVQSSINESDTSVVLSTIKRPAEQDAVMAIVNTTLVATAAFSQAVIPSAHALHHLVTTKRSLSTKLTSMTEKYKTASHLPHTILAEMKTYLNKTVSLSAAPSADRTTASSADAESVGAFILDGALACVLTLFLAAASVT